MKNFKPENIINSLFKKKVNSGDDVKDVFPYTQSFVQNIKFCF